MLTVLGEGVPMGVRVMDSEGRPVPNTAVRFEADADEGVLATTAAISDAEGRAVTSFTPYGFVGERIVRASIDGAPSQAFLVTVTAEAEHLAGFDHQDVYVRDATDSGMLVGNTSGSSDLPLNSTAVRWTETRGLELLPIPDTDVQVRATNSEGVIVGFAFHPFGQLAVQWRDGAATSLPDDESGSSSANDVNSAGDIVGHGSGAVLWRQEQIIRFRLHHETPGFFHEWIISANAINDEGQTVGNAPSLDWNGLVSDVPVGRAVLWETEHTLPFYLPIPVPDEYTTRATAINNVGEVLVESYPETFRGPESTFFWSSEEGAIEIGVGSEAVRAVALNDSSWIGGSVGFIPAVWKSPGADPVLLPSLQADYRGGQVTALTNDGWAAGNSTYSPNDFDSHYHMVRWRVYLPRP